MTKKPAISRSRCGLMTDAPDPDVGLIGRTWIRGTVYKGSPLVGESPSIYLIPPQSACHLNVPSPLSLLPLSPPSVNNTNVSFNVGPSDTVTIFTFTLIFLLSPKRPNTRSNHDMALSYLILSYLILSYLIFSHFKVTPSRRGKQIVLENR